MYCRKCGTQNWETAQKCIKCGEPMAGGGTGVGSAPAGMPGQPIKIKNYLVESILVTLLCCLPFGIAGIINAAQVNSKFAGGDIAGAQAAADNAKKMCLIGTIGGFVVMVIYFILIIAGAVKP